MILKDYSSRNTTKYLTEKKRKTAQHIYEYLKIILIIIMNVIY